MPQSVIDQILQSYERGRQIDTSPAFRPDRRRVKKIISALMQILCPGYWGDGADPDRHIRDTLCLLEQEVATTYGENTRQLCLDYLGEMPALRSALQEDLLAAYEGDPAATGVEEILFAYPGFFAVTVYRLANALHRRKVSMLPRMMTEYAHSLTGIDIHPGASIGPAFFIDHGTGVVIGESTEIGRNVRIYQGVTLGALTTMDTKLLRGSKRHPTIEDDVTIYAGASILGGKTVIGRGSVIGANVFLTQSVEPDTVVRIRGHELEFRTRV
jgi:serine O-acetyltransferase